MRNRAPTSQREVDRLCKRIWNDAVRGRCMMQGIKTPQGLPPTFCGPGVNPRAHDNHTIANNIMRAADLDGAGKVVTFTPATEITNWSPRFFEDPVYANTPIGIATVGRYACKWHDDLFNIIDLIRNYRDSEEIATMLAFRATLLAHFLAQRNWLYFSRRAKVIPDHVREGRMSQRDREVSERAGVVVASLSKEIDYIVECLKSERPTKIHTDSFVLKGKPTIGGTAVWGAHIGHPVSCTIVPMSEGHRIHVTYRRTLLNGVQRAASALLSRRTSDVMKRRILSEIALEHYQTVFILKHKWKALKADEQESIGRIVKDVDARYGARTRWFRRNHWMLRGNPDVPNLFT